MQWQLRLLTTISDISQSDWDSLFVNSYPFSRYHFLHALEQGGSVNTNTSGNTGWQALHLMLQDENGSIIALMPAYLKFHSYGEYLFDWQFARAYQQYGLSFYPKLVNAIPFTPAEGPRVAIAAGANERDVFHALYHAVQQLMTQYGLSQFQSLYCSQTDAKLWQECNLLQRHDVQFQWFNRGYSHFDDFLAAFTSRKRKQIRKQRQQIQAQGLQLVTLTGHQLDPTTQRTLWLQFYQFYCATYQKRSGHNGYLTLQTFLLWAQHLAEQMVMFAAYDKDNLVAAALCFRSADTLYGRYWGCSAEYNSLHFECCYYQGIDYCIRHQLAYFDAGAQGEHKLQRGFEPVLRQGGYLVSANMLSDAIKRFCLDEQTALKQYAAAASQQLPFKKT